MCYVAYCWQPLLVVIKFLTARATDTNYNVVDTDYENFAIVYSCNNKLFFKTGKKRKQSSALIWNNRFLLRNYALHTMHLTYSHTMLFPPICFRDIMGLDTAAISAEAVNT